MKRLILAAAVAALFFSFSTHAAKFTYHGDLMDGDAPADGSYDLRVRSYAYPNAVGPLGLATEMPGVAFSEGSFNVELDLPENPHGTTWVEVAVRKSGSGGEYVTLGAPQAVAKANTGAWALDGNTGTPAGSFLGLVERKPLIFKVHNKTVATFTPRGIESNFGDAPSVALGSPANVASNHGATVGGGGSTRLNGAACPTCKNTASGQFSTISGGLINTASAELSTVGGGGANVASGKLSTVNGGSDNTASGAWSTAGGGVFNCAGGQNSWAGGLRAKVRPGTASGAKGFGCADVALSGDANGDEGSFVWADNQNTPFTTSGPNQFLIRADGGVGINTSRFGNAVNLRLGELVIANGNGNGNTDIVMYNKTTNRGYNLAIVPGTNGAAGDFYIGETDARTANVVFTNRLRIDAAGTTFVRGGAVGNLSDARLKKNVAPIQKPLETLLALRGQMFEYIDPAASMNAPGLRMGFIAQEVQQAIPGWVNPTGKDGYLAVTPVGFEALTVEAIRDLKAESDVRIEHLEAQNAALRGQLEALTARLARLEARRGK